jgi:xanthine dehydrogenase YagR molybdenum-binding subunit
MTAPLAGLKPDEIASRDGGLCKFDEQEKFESYASILGRH